MAQPPSVPDKLRRGPWGRGAGGCAYSGALVKCWERSEVAGLRTAMALSAHSCPQFLFILLIPPPSTHKSPNALAEVPGNGEEGGDGLQGSPSLKKAGLELCLLPSAS